MTVTYSEPYRRISPLVRPVLPGILGSLYPPWCSGIGTVRSVPEEREDYQLLGDSWWWISNSTVAPLNRRPTGSTGVKMASRLHPGNPRSTLHLRLHPSCQVPEKSHSPRFTPTNSIQTKTNLVISDFSINLTFQ